MVSNTCLFRYNIKTAQATQQILGFYNSLKQFNVCPAGRRALKSTTAKRRLKKRSFNAHNVKSPFYVPNRTANYFIACPTMSQTIRIYWKDMIALCNPFIRDINKTQRTIELVNGTTIYFMSGETPERFEGMMWDGGILDEYGNMREDVWTEHISECLADTDGYCDFIGVPEGMNHYYKLYLYAQQHPEQWDTWHWVSKDVLPDSTIELYREMLDEITFRQEMEGSFENYQGRAYYNFDRKECCMPLTYDPQKPIGFCFDFNVSPGVAAVVQGQELPAFRGLGVIDEVYVAKNSNTKLITDLLIKKYQNHQSVIEVDGDASGGARKSCSDKTDWEIALKTLREAFPNRVYAKYPRNNPYVRDRINAVNVVLKNGKGERHIMFDAAKCPHTINDFDAVSLDDKGELDKSNLTLTHLSDALGYRIARTHPIIKYDDTLPKYWK